MFCGDHLFNWNRLKTVDPISDSKLFANTKKSNLERQKSNCIKASLF